VICYIYGAGNDYNGKLGARISSVFVVLITSTVVTFFPVVAKRVEALKIPNWAYIIARYFGSGVILATAFVHLLDPS
jgi:zinc transporter 1/2/3